MSAHDSVCTRRSRLQSSRRLVEHDDRCFLRERTSHEDALVLSARERVANDQFARSLTPVRCMARSTALERSAESEPNALVRQTAHADHLTNGEVELV